MIQEIGDRIFDNHYRPDIRMRAEDELFLFDEKSGEIGMKESEDGMLEMQVLRKRSASTCSPLTIPGSLCQRANAAFPCRRATSIGLLGFSERENRKTCALPL